MSRRGTNFLSWLPVWAEMVIVIFVGFGLFIYSSTYYLAFPDTLPPATAGDLRQMIVTEITLAAALGGFLWARGWRMPQLGFVALTWDDLRHAALLFAATIAAGWISYYIASLLRPGLEQASVELNNAVIPLALTLSFSLVNACFEETFVCAYLIAAWRGHDLWSAIAISSVVRLSYHFYQGAVAVAMIFPLGVLFAWYFARHRRLLPLLLAHAALDVLALWQANGWRF